VDLFTSFRSVALVVHYVRLPKWRRSRVRISPGSQEKESLRTSMCCLYEELCHPPVPRSPMTESNIALPSLRLHSLQVARSAVAILYPTCAVPFEDWPIDTTRPHVVRNNPTSVPFFQTVAECIGSLPLVTNGRPSLNLLRTIIPLQIIINPRRMNPVRMGLTDVEGYNVR